MAGDDSKVSRLLVALLALVLLMEGVMYSVLTPLLPRLTDILELSKTAAGTLYSAYMVGSLSGAILGALVLRRSSMRRTTQVGFLLLGLFAVGFGLSDTYGEALAFRTATGLAGGLSWVSAMSWLLSAESASRRGAAVGTAMSVAMFGTLLGPLLGNLAVAVGDVEAFSAVAVLCAAAVPLFPREGPRTQVSARVPHAGGPRRALVRRLVGSAWVLAVTAFTYGAIYVLLPLRLDGHGMSQLGIGWLFVISAAISVVVITTVGKLVDRVGAHRLAVVAMAADAVLCFYLAVGGSTLVLSVLGVVASVGVVLAFGVTPVATAVSLDADDLHLPNAATSMTMLIVFAAAEGLGGVLVPAAAEQSSDSAAFAALMLLAAASTVVAWTGHRSRARSQGLGFGHGALSEVFPSSPSDAHN
jgi:predicted MFS family arabinose efflux permease